MYVYGSGIDSMPSDHNSSFIFRKESPQARFENSAQEVVNSLMRRSALLTRSESALQYHSLKAWSFSGLTKSTSDRKMVPSPSSTSSTASLML